ncbi:MAG TPA: hypothetical protein VLT90_04450 [Terriglobales bacterium]|nr:hypothetical protein [Terriglobales bacterium]
MRTFRTFLLALALGCVAACSPRDFLTRRLAADLISGNDTFSAPQVFWLRTGIVSNRDFSFPDTLVLQRRGWIIGTQQPKCPPGVDPPPCWDVVLSPAGVETFRPLLPAGPQTGNLAPIRVAHRELVEVTGISKAGNFAEVEFLWHWIPLNDVGSALYDSGVRYRSTVGFRSYDDGWRVITEPMKNGQPLDEALSGARPAP